MKKLLLFLTLFPIQLLFGQQDNELDKMLIESILDYKCNYESCAARLQSYDRNLYLCSDNLPIRWKNQEFYESISMETLTWENTQKRFFKEMKKGFDLIEIQYFVFGNTIDIQIFEYEITRKRKHIFQGFSSVCHYIYQYNCDTNKWERMKIEKHGI